MVGPSRSMWLEGLGPVLTVEVSTPTEDIVEFAAVHHPAGPPALGVSPMWPWQRHALVERLSTAGIATRTLRRTEVRALRRISTNRFAPDHWWQWPLFIPAFVFGAGRRVLGRGMKLLVVESIAGAPPEAPSGGDDRAPRPDPSSPRAARAAPDLGGQS